MNNFKETVLNITSKYKIPIICFIFLLLFCHIYIIQSHMYIESDLSNMVLEADDFLKGNFLLRGWNNEWFSTGITYLTTDLLYFLFSVGLFGISKTSVYLGCSLYAFMTFITAFLLIKDDLKKLTVSNLIIFLLICGLSFSFIKCMHVHCGCFVWSYIIFFLAARYLNTENQKYLIPILILLSVSIFGDMIAVTLVVLPMIIYACCKMFYKQEFDKYIPLVKYLILSIAISSILLKLYLNAAHIVYNFQPLTFIKPEELYYNFILVAKEIVLVFGAGEYYTHRIFNIWTNIIAIGGFAVLFAGAYLVFLNIKESLTNKETDFISVCLSYSIIIQIALLFLTTYNNDIHNARYIAFMPINCAIMILRRYNCFEMFSKKQFSIIVSCLALVFCISAIYSYNKYENKVSSDYLETILNKHNLTHGVNNEYWGSSSVTVSSKNKIKVRNIELDDKGNIIPSTWFSKKDWYDEPVEFVAININSDNARGIRKLVENKSKSRIDFMEYRLFIIKDEYKNSIITHKKSNKS